MARSKAAEANRLYWESAESVADIAQRLELSRRALYDAIVPLPAGRECDECGGPLTYDNRSARNADNAICAACTSGEDVPVVAAVPPAVLVGADEHPAVRMAAAAVAGAALGALVTLVFVPRR